MEVVSKKSRACAIRPTPVIRCCPFYDPDSFRVYYANSLQLSDAEKIVAIEMLHDFPPELDLIERNIVFIHGVPSLCEAAENFDKFCGIKSAISHQHIKLRGSRIKKDDSDARKFLEWFQQHPPFIVRNELMSLSNGIIGDESAINCKKKIYDTVTPIDTNLFYQRILSTFKQDDELEEYFKFELSPIPQSLFDELGMRKTVKSSLYPVFQEIRKDLPDFIKVYSCGKKERKLDDHPASSRRRNTAISYATTNPSVIIVGEDVDVMVLIVALTPEDKDIYLLKPEKGENKNVINSSAAEQKRHSSIKNHLLFLHATSGCDTTSSFMNKRKKTFFKLLKNNPTVSKKMKIFNSEDVTEEKIAEAGEELTRVLYKGKKGESVDRLRYVCFTQATARSKTQVKLESLPPTSGAAKMHFLRELPIILSCDASQTDVAKALHHKFSDGSERPIRFVSRTLTPAEKNYSMIRHLFRSKEFQKYLQGQKLILKTDHKPLIAIFGEYKGILQMAASRLQRWAIYLSGFNYTIEYVKGVNNEVDYFSCSPLDQSRTVPTRRKSGNYLNFIESLDSPIDLDRIRVETGKNPVIDDVSKFVNNGWSQYIKNVDITPYVRRKGTYC
ncbi:hypothetical protein ILUMI_05270 [Ignelater luminosus]|uniref:Reverse transcriptase RNase H-like domain-containing protein n=1 Tax=Ignelater luminosus TaxID=2038154 RepID=A0A8K0GIT7_IGNLU|nr:hypothetical protein ILUMI_05270 [Ignelater luminosus]